MHAMNMEKLIGLDLGYFNQIGSAIWSSQGIHTPWKIHIERSNEGLERCFSIAKRVIFRFQPLIFRGVHCHTLFSFCSEPVASHFCSIAGIRKGYDFLSPGCYLALGWFQEIW